MGLWPRPKHRRQQKKPPPIATLEEGNPFAEEGTLIREKRNEAAASLLDEDTYGYIVIRLVKDESDGFEGRVEVDGHVREEWRAPFLATLSRITQDGLPTDL